MGFTYFSSYNKIKILLPSVISNSSLPSVTLNTNRFVCEISLPAANNAHTESKITVPTVDY